jgi:hypothetical protein
MPETSVNENRHPPFSKNKIRFPEDWLLAPPAGNTVRAENVDESKFGCLIAVAANPRHHFGSLCLGKDVSHKLQKRVLVSLSLM